MNIFSGPQVGLRAVRILHDLDVAGKKLVAKVDAKNKLLLDNYKEEEGARNVGNEDASEAHEKKEDADVVDAIQQILADHRTEIENYEAIQGLYSYFLFILFGLFYVKFFICVSTRKYI